MEHQQRDAERAAETETRCSCNSLGGKLKKKLNSTTAAYAASIFTMLEIVPCVAILMDRLTKGDREEDQAIAREFRTVIYVAFGMYTLLALSSLALMLGIRKNEKLLFVPWMTVVVSLLIFEAIVIMIHKKHQLDERLHHWEVIFMISFTTRLVINVIALCAVLYRFKEVQREDEEASLRSRTNRGHEADPNVISGGRIQHHDITMKPPPYLEKPPSYCSRSPPPTYRLQPDVPRHVVNSEETIFHPTSIDGARLQPTAPPFIPPPAYTESEGECVP